MVLEAGWVLEEIRVPGTVVGVMENKPVLPSLFWIHRPRVLALI